MSKEKVAGESAEVVDGRDEPAQRGIWSVECLFKTGVDEYRGEDANIISTLEYVSPGLPVGNCDEI